MRQLDNGNRRTWSFLARFLRAPMRVGAVAPSSRFVERQLVKNGDLGDASVVVELGPGTGGTTRAILAALGPDARLLALELDPAFVSILRRINDPRLVVRQAPAQKLLEVLDELGLPAVDVVFSGIPFSTMEPEVARETMTGIQRSLRSGGRFIAYQYRDHVARFGSEVFGSPKSSIELRNLPPTRIFRWTTAPIPD